MLNIYSKALTCRIIPAAAQIRSRVRLISAVLIACFFALLLAGDHKVGSSHIFTASLKQLGGLNSADPLSANKNSLFVANASLSRRMDKALMSTTSPKLSQGLLSRVVAR